MNFEVLRSAIENAARAENLDVYEIYYREGEETSVETLGGEVNAFCSGASSGICLRVLSNGRMGYAATEVMSEDEMRALVRRAIENAGATEKEDTVGIYSGGGEYEGFDSGETRLMDTAELKRAALRMSESLYKESDCITDGSSTSAFSTRFAVRLVNSEGLDLSNVGGVSAISAEAVISKDGSSESAYEIKPLDSDTDFSGTAKHAVDTAMARLGAVSVASGKYNIIIDAKRMRSLLSAFVSVFSAKNAQMGLSLLSGKEGERIASEVVTITDDPARDGAFVKTNFDAEGYPAKRKTVIKNGILQTLLHNRETAKRAGTESTGNASKAGYASSVSVSPYAFCIEAGEYTREELYRECGEGILITEIKGLHAGANAVTGDFSLESGGFMIRGGRLCEAVRSFTVSGNFFELLKSVRALSDTLEIGISGSASTFGSPDVLIEGLIVAGK